MSSSFPTVTSPDTLRQLQKLFHQICRDYEVGTQAGELPLPPHQPPSLNEQERQILRYHLNSLSNSVFRKARAHIVVDKALARKPKGLAPVDAAMAANTEALEAKVLSEREALQTLREETRVQLSKMTQGSLDKLRPRDTNTADCTSKQTDKGTGVRKAAGSTTEMKAEAPEAAEAEAAAAGYPSATDVNRLHRLQTSLDKEVSRLTKAIPQTAEAVNNTTTHLKGCSASGPSALEKVLLAASTLGKGIGNDTTTNEEKNGKEEEEEEANTADKMAKRRTNSLAARLRAKPY